MNIDFFHLEIACLLNKEGVGDIMIDIQSENIIKNLTVYEKFADIISNCNIKTTNYNKVFVLKYESIKFVKEFFKSYDEDYYNEFIKFLRQNRLVLKHGINDGYSKVNNKVYINYRRSIDDCLAIIHEFIHYMHNGWNKTNKLEPLKEVNSLIHELLLSDYVSRAYNTIVPVSQVGKNINEESMIAKDAKMELELYKYTIQGKTIDIDSLPYDLANYLINTKPLYSNSRIGTYSIYLIGDFIEK